MLGAGAMGVVRQVGASATGLNNNQTEMGNNCLFYWSAVRRRAPAKWLSRSGTATNLLASGERQAPKSIELRQLFRAMHLCLLTEATTGESGKQTDSRSNNNGPFFSASAAVHASGHWLRPSVAVDVVAAAGGGG